jgi:hypothetical protein
MDKKLTQTILSRILALDEEAEAFKKQAAGEIKSKKLDFSKKLKDLEGKYMEQIKKESLEASRDILDDADHWRDYILSESDAATAYLEGFLKEHEEILLDQVLIRLFKEEKG